MRPLSIIQNTDSSPIVIKIPPGVLHSCKVLSNSADLFYITSHTYDPKDEGRWAYDSSYVGYDWGEPSELIVAGNDCVDYQPEHQLEG